MKKLLSIIALCVLLFTFTAVTAFAMVTDESETDISDAPTEAEPIPDDTGAVTNGEEITLDSVMSAVESAIDTALEKIPAREDVTDWKSYIKDILIPAAVTAISAIAAAYVAALPLINSVKSVIKTVTDSVSLFKGATNDVNTVTASKEETEKKLAELREDISFIKKHIGNIESIERIGFGNMKELVVGGFAGEIGKVGKEDENAS